MPFIDRSSKRFRILSLSFVLIIASIITKVFIENWHKISFKELTFDYRFLIISILIYILNLSFTVWLWKYILALLGDKAAFLPLCRVFVYAQTSRYIPGKIWQYLSKVYWGLKIGLSKKKIILSSILETVFLLSGAFIVSLFSIELFMSKNYYTLNYLIIVSILICILLITVHPGILGKILNTIGKRFISSRVTLTFPYYHMLIIVFLYAFSWVLYGFSVFCFILSFYKIDFNHYIPIVSLQAGSWLIGFLSLIAPNGLGVKESIFILGFKSIVPVSFAIMCVILLRLFQIALDVVIFAICLVFDKGAWKNFIDLKKSQDK
jgi:hypothetical protein